MKICKKCDEMNPDNANYCSRCQNPLGDSTVAYSDPRHGGSELSPEAPVSMGDWMLTMFLMCIPFVGIIMLFIYAFGDNTKKSKQNWAKAQLVYALIITALSIIGTLFWVFVFMTMNI